MFKLLLVGVILSQDVCNILGTPIMNERTDTTVENILSSMTVPTSNDTNEKVLSDSVLPGNYYFHATHQRIYFNAPHGGKDLEELNSDDSEKKIRSDYTVTKGIRAHKLHRRKISWNKARHICITEGAHLAIIRSEAEETIVRRMMHAESIKQAWVGFHDKYEEGDWVTVLDEPIGAIPWAPWSRLLPVNPDNAGGNEHCAVLIEREGGINDDNCSRDFPFICKISIN